MNPGPVSGEIAAIIFVALLVGAVTKGVTGFGLPMVAVPLLSGLLGVERAVVVMVIPTFVSNFWLLWEHRTHVTAARRALPLFLTAGVIGTIVGAAALAALSAQALALILAAWLGLYLVMQFSNPGIAVPVRSRRPLGAAVGFIAGLAQGAMGVPGPIVATWFHALRLEPAVYVFSVCAVFFVTSGVQIVSLSLLGLLAGDRLIEGLFALIPTMIGLPLGIRLARFIDARIFNWCLLAILGLTEMRLIWQGLFE